ncbi:MAG TPA: FG-GAP-like repeat-containing protein, partial [Gemmatimonadaceae bacterium]|nr:FG-GAP-like repeat-containing protein [Gemmatimonadaceae bacterium]
MSRAGIALVLALALACPRAERASVEDLYTTRMLGLSYLQRNQLSEAEAEFTKLTKLAPDDPLGYANLGLTYMQAGRYAEAEQQLKRARELDPRGTEIGLALARVYALTNRPADARATLEQLRRDSSANAHVLFALAELESRGTDPASMSRYRDRLHDVLGVAPANLAARLKLVDAIARAGQADSVVSQLEEVRRIPPEPPPQARATLDSVIALARAGRLADARPTLDRFLRAMETTSPYQAALEEVKWTEGAIPGRPVLTFAPKNFISTQGVRERATVDVATYVDATSDAGLPTAPAAPAPPAATPSVVALAVGDLDGDNVDDLFLSTTAAGTARTHLYRIQGAAARDVTAGSRLALPRGAAFATFADADNDGWLDLFVIGADGRGQLFRNDGKGALAELASATIPNVNGARRALFADLDHDGDLDLLLVGSAGRALYRNNLNGTFTESAAALGLASTNDERDAAVADFDDDGRLDVVVAGASGVTLLRNGGAQRFADATASSGLQGSGANASVVLAADYDNDGAIDLFVASGGEGTLWRNRGNATFVRDTRSASALQALRGAAIASAVFVDHDNDGWLDLVVGSTGGANGLVLLRNDGTGKFLDRSTILPASLRTVGALALAVSDVDDDGDEDITFVDAGGAPRLLRNEQGNANLAVNVELRGLGAGSGKNNA